MGGHGGQKNTVPQQRWQKKKEVRVVGPEDDMDRLGYDVAGKGVKSNKTVREERLNKHNKGDPSKMAGVGGKGKDAEWKQNPCGWRGHESGDQHRQQKTVSSPRSQANAAGRGTGGRPEHLVVASTAAYHTTAQHFHPEASLDDDIGTESESFSTEGFSNDIGCFPDHSDSQDTSSYLGDEGTTSAEDFVSLTGRFAPGRQGSSGRDAGPSGSWQVNWPGGPTFDLAIPSYGGHIAPVIWEGGERTPHEVIECLTRKTQLRELLEIKRKMHPEAVAAIDQSPLSGIGGLMFEHIDHALIAAFVERWQPDTNSFHLPFGEMTIMLHDVQEILGLPVDGALPPCPDRDMVNDYARQIFFSSPKELRLDTFYREGGIPDSELRNMCTDIHVRRQTQTRAWLLSLLGNTLLVDKSTDRVRPHAWESTKSVDRVAWGTVTLAYLYRQLGEASRAGSRKIGGCLTLLQAWIYEHFPQFRPIPLPDDVPPGPRASRWFKNREPRSLERLKLIRSKLDGLTKQQVVWCPYRPTPARDCPRTLYMGCIRAFDCTELYMPDRVVRQLGYRQHIPGRPLRPMKASRPANGAYVVVFDDLFVDAQWQNFPVGHRLSLDVLSRCTTVPWETGSSINSNTPIDYSTWYGVFSHPFLINSDIPGDFPFYDDHASADYWANEWPRRVQLLTHVHRGRGPTVPVPVETYDALMDIYRKWCECMRIEVPKLTNDDDHQ